MHDLLCARYPGLTPFVIRREFASEVFLLAVRIYESERYEKKHDKTKKQLGKKTGNARLEVNNDTATGGWY